MAPATRTTETSSCTGSSRSSAMPNEIIYQMNSAQTVAIITLNRPASQNAVNADVKHGLWLCVERIKHTPTLRVVFLTGTGAMFCAGGDPKSFQQIASATQSPADADARDDDEAALLFELNSLPVYVVGLANGSAMGGGVGFLSLCDCVVARKTAFFALSEVKLGMIPATISPYVIAKIGPANARRLFMSGETIDADEAKAIGLVQKVVDTAEALMKAAQRICEEMASTAPHAVAAAKKLVRDVQYQAITPELMEMTQAELVRLSCSEECAAGMDAVQRGKKPPWNAQDLSLPTR